MRPSTDVEGGSGVVVFRPRRLRVLAAATSVVLCALTLVGWFALPRTLRDSFTLAQRLTLLALLGVLLVAMISVAASYVRADDSGMRLRNGFRRHSVTWDQVHKILLRPGDPWGVVLLLPEDGRDFEVSTDVEKRQLMAIQANDGEAARQAILALRQRHQRANRR